MTKKEKVNIKKIILAIIFSIIGVFAIIKPTSALSGSGSGNWTGGQYDTFIKTTESVAYNRGILARKLTNVDTGEKVTVFCAEHTEDFVVGVTNSGSYYAPTDEKVKKACKIAYFGWYSKYKDLVVDLGIQADDKYNLRLDYAFTQQYIWEVLGQSNATFVDSNIQKQYVTFKIEIDKKIVEIEKKPSFNNQTISLDAGEEKVITDTNGVLKDYSSIDKTMDDIKFTHTKGQNTLKISVPENCKIETVNLSEQILNSWGMIKEETKENNTTVYLEFKQGVQNQLYSMNYNSPVNLSFSIKITPLGKLELSKTNENGKLIDGSTFQVSGPNGFNKEVKITNGKVLLEKLKIGTYSVKEKTAPTGYLLNTNTYNVQVKVGETTSLKIANEKPTGTLVVNKTVKMRKEVDKSFVTIDYSKISFKLIAKEEIKDILDGSVIYKKNAEVKTFNLNKDGKAEITNLPMGTYELQEIKTLDGLVLNNEKYEVKFEKKDSETKVYKEIKNIENDTTLVEISKKDITGTDEELIGAKLFVIDENNKIIDSWITTKVTHKIEGLVTGKTYALREQSAPYGYNISEDIKFTVQNDMTVQKVEMKDAPILTNIQVEKVDSETNENIKSSYFSFGIYEDEECTKLIKKVEANQERGIVLFENLRYGTYFIKELNAPIGYELSNKKVKIEIGEDGAYVDGKLLEGKRDVYSFKYYNLPLQEVQTGDETNQGLLIILVMTFGAIISGIIVRVIRKNSKNK